MLIRFFLIRFFLFLSALSAIASGQAKEDPNRYVRILPLGNLFDPPQKLEKGILLHQAPTSEQAPPARIVIKDELGLAKPARLTVNRLARFTALGPEVSEVQLSDAKTPAKVWVKFPAPTAKRTLAILYRDHEKLDWRVMKSLVLKDDAKSFPLSAARFVNVSDRIVKLHFTLIKDGKKVTRRGQIKPGQSYIRPLSARGERVKITLPTEGEDLFVREEMLKPHKDKRIQFFFYKNQSGPKAEVPRAPVRVVTFPEGMPPLPELPKTEKTKGE